MTIEKTVNNKLSGAFTPESLEKAREYLKLKHSPVRLLPGILRNHCSKIRYTDPMIYMLKNEFDTYKGMCIENEKKKQIKELPKENERYLDF